MQAKITALKNLKGMMAAGTGWFNGGVRPIPNSVWTGLSGAAPMFGAFNGTHTPPDLGHPFTVWVFGVFACSSPANMGRTGSGGDVKASRAMNGLPGGKAGRTALPRFLAPWFGRSLVCLEKEIPPCPKPFGAP